MIHRLTFLVLFPLVALGQQGLPINTQVPDVRLKPERAKAYQLSEAYGQGPVVLVFYRGQWCPYCNLYLRTLSDSLGQLTARGARVIAISPEIPENVARTLQKTGATYDVVSDTDGKLMQAFRVAFAVDSLTQKRYQSRGLDLGAANGTPGRATLPVPATYIIGRDGKVVYRHVDPDYKHRPTVAQLLAALPK